MRYFSQGILLATLILLSAPALPCAQAIYDVLRVNELRSHLQTLEVDIKAKRVNDADDYTLPLDVIREALIENHEFQKYISHPNFSMPSFIKRIETIVYDSSLDGLQRIDHLTDLITKDLKKEHRARLASDQQALDLPKDKASLPGREIEQVTEELLQNGIPRIENPIRLPGHTTLLAVMDGTSSDYEFERWFPSIGVQFKQPVLEKLNQSLKEASLKHLTGDEGAGLVEIVRGGQSGGPRVYGISSLVTIQGKKYTFLVILSAGFKDDEARALAHARGKAEKARTAVKQFVADRNR